MAVVGSKGTLAMLRVTLHSLLPSSRISLYSLADSYLWTGLSPKSMKPESGGPSARNTRDWPGLAACELFANIPSHDREIPLNRDVYLCRLGKRIMAAGMAPVLISCLWISEDPT